MNKLKQKITNLTCPVIFYELIPPRVDMDHASIKAYARCAADLVTCAQVAIDAINIPDIRDESTNGQKRGDVFVAKMDAREFISELKQAIETPMDFVINRATVYEDLAQQNAWLADTLQKYEIQNLILVGGESSKMTYPGPSVIEACRLLAQHFPSAFFGGITIPSRRKAQHTLDEPCRLMMKTKHGIDFFTTQVLYEAHSICQLLQDYDEQCKQQKIPAKRILLSFAPISTRKDLEFLRWLGVNVPQSVEQELFLVDMGIGWRSMKITKTILQAILQFVRSHRITVPIGLNIEHVTRHNFELSKEFIHELGRVYLSHGYVQTGSLAH